MKPNQIRLRKKFYDLNKKLDDVIINQVVPQLEERMIDELEFMYEEISSVCKESKISLYEVTYNFNSRNIAKIYEYIVYLGNRVDITLKKINILGDAMRTSDEITESVKDIIDDMKRLRVEALYTGDNKQSTIIQLYSTNALKKYADIVELVIVEHTKNYIDKINIEIDNFYFDHNYEKLQKMLKESLQKPSNEDKETNQLREKIFNHKKMNKLAIQNGFVEVRQRGDHKIFSNGTDSIPIPQHELGKGLSIKIQKQIDVYNSKIK